MSKIVAAIVVSATLMVIGVSFYYTQREGLDMATAAVGIAGTFGVLLQLSVLFGNPYWIRWCTATNEGENAPAEANDVQAQQGNVGLPQVGNVLPNGGLHGPVNAPIPQIADGLAAVGLPFDDGI